MKVYLGIDIGGTNVKIVVVGRSGKVHTRGVIDTIPGEGPRKTFRRIKAAADTLANFRKDVEIAGAGVGCAGLVDPDRGFLFSSPNLAAWENSPLKRIAERALGVYVTVNNDADAGAWGECQRGRNRVRNLVFLTLGTGVGGGVVADGRLLRGASKFGPEPGHMTISPDGPKCRCGNRGCLEAYAGTYGLIRCAKRQMKEKKSTVLARWVGKERRRLTPHLIFEAARRRDTAALAVVRETGTYLGVGIASLVNIFNPEVVVFGGGVSASFDLLHPHIEREFRRRVITHSARKLAIVRSVLENDATAVGAAMLVKDSLGKRG